MSLPKFFKKPKFLLFSGIILSLLLIFASHSYAMYSPGEITAPEETPKDYKTNIWEPAVYQTEEINQQSFSNETIMAVSASISDQILGCVNCPPSYQGQSAIKGLGNLMAKMYANPPASSVEYFADLGRNLGVFAKPAYAQGIGFEGLKPILPIWKAFRNIAYLFFVIIFVFIGFAIMFRVKIDPQTVVSIQNALPKLVLALILVTFSYAIAGFMIDLIYVFTFLAVALFQNSSPQLITKGIAEVQTSLLQPSIFNFIKDMFSSHPENIAGAISQAVEQIIGVGTFTGAGLGFVAGGIALLIFAIALLFVTFKVFFQLLMAYIGIILGVILAPLMLMLEAVPGQGGLTNWLKMMLSNIIIFPLVAVVLMLAAVLTGSEGWGVPQGIGYGQGTTGWVAPMIGIGTDATQALIGFGMMLMLPSIIDMVKKAIGAPGIGAGVMAPIAGAAGVVTAGPRALWTQTGGAVMEETRKARADTIRRGLPGPDWLVGRRESA